MAGLSECETHTSLMDECLLEPVEEPLEDVHVVCRLHSGSTADDDVV